MAEANKKEQSEKETSQLFEEEIKKPYYDVFYLDNFKLPYERLDVSVVLPTYNRAPYKKNTLKEDLNPLSWAILSCLNQKPPIKEIIVVDDASKDNTAEVVKSFREEATRKNINLVYIQNETHQGYGPSTNIGVEKTNSKYLLFVDDDSIIAPYTAFGGIHTFEWLETEGVNVGIINLPPYLRSTLPENVKSQKSISQINFSKGVYTSNKASFPEEYLTKKDKFIHEEYHILKPFTIQNSGGYFLCSKKMFNDIGGFPVTICERFPEREFGCIAIDNGYDVYFQADPKFHCVHGSYGLKNDRIFKGKEWFKEIGGKISFKRAMEVCNNRIKETGCRISQKEFVYNSLMAIFTVLYPRNSRGAIKWMEKIYQSFVINNDPTMLNTSLNENLSEEERKDIWEKAIKESLNFIRKKEKMKLKALSDLKNNLKNKKITLDMLKIIGEI